MTGRTALIGGRYEPLAVLGVGGEALVLRALDLQHQRTVVLKVRPTPDAPTRAAALAEARTLLGVEVHRNIPVLRDDFFTDGDHVMVLEHVDGENLADRLRRCGKPGLPFAEVVRWLGDIAAALDHLHGQATPIVHGDVKPANMVVASATHHTVLIDFGAAGPHGSSSGTRRYSAPEVSRSATPAADVFALAASAYELLTGRPPEPGLPEVDAALSAGLATDPANRPRTASALIEAVARYTRETATSPR